MPGVRFLSLFLLLFLLPDEIVSIFWTGAGLAERESEGGGRWLEGEGTAVPGRAVSLVSPWLVSCGGENTRKG